MAKVNQPWPASTEENLRTSRKMPGSEAEHGDGGILQCKPEGNEATRAKNLD